MPTNLNFANAPPCIPIVFSLALFLYPTPIVPSLFLPYQSLCQEKSDITALLPSLRPHWMRDFFEASCMLALHLNTEGLEKCAEMVTAGMADVADPGSGAADVAGDRSAAGESQDVGRMMRGEMGALTALAHYNLRDFDAAEGVFQQILTADPYRVDGLDTLSNILYVKEKAAALSHLAHKAVLVDKYRAETCCVVGNYYSLTGRHDRAVASFKRALKLDPRCVGLFLLLPFPPPQGVSGTQDAYVAVLGSRRRCCTMAYPLFLVCILTLSLILVLIPL